MDNFTDYERVMDEQQKDATTFDGNESYPPVEEWNQKHPKMKVKKWCSRLVHFAKMSLYQLKMILRSLCGLHVFVFMPHNIIKRPQVVSWRISSQIWTRTSLSSWTVWGDTWKSWMDLNIMSQKCSPAFRSGVCGGQSIVFIPSSFRTCLQPLATQIWPLSAPGGTQNHLHLCRFWEWSKDSIPTPKSSHRAIIQPAGSMYPSRDMPLQTIIDPPPNRSN